MIGLFSCDVKLVPLVICSVVLFFMVGGILGKVGGGCRLLLGSAGRLTRKRLSLPVRNSIKVFHPVRSRLGGVRDKFGGTMSRRIGGRHVGARLIAGISRSLHAPLATVVACVSLLGGRGSRRGEGRCARMLREGSLHLGTLVRSLFRVDGTTDGAVRVGCVGMSLMKLVHRTRLRGRRGVERTRLRFH